MTIFLVTFLVMVIAILAMAVGVLVGRRPIGGSCGGLEPPKRAGSMYRLTIAALFPEGSNWRSGYRARSTDYCRSPRESPRSL